MALGKFVDIFAAILGIIAANFALKKLICPALKETGTQQIVPYISVSDVVGYLIGLVLIFFGGRVHRLVRWFGIGWFIGSLAGDIREYIWGMNL